MRDFLITYEIKGIERKNLFSVSKPTGDIGQDAKTALNLFIANFGNLKKNKIISIQEVDAEGAAIGLPITPQEESSIVPFGKKREN